MRHSFIGNGVGFVVAIGLFVAGLVATTVTAEAQPKPATTGSASASGSTAPPVLSSSASASAAPSASGSAAAPKTLLGSLIDYENEKRKKELVGTDASSQVCAGARDTIVTLLEQRRDGKLDIAAQKLEVAAACQKVWLDGSAAQDKVAEGLIAEKIQAAIDEQKAKAAAPVVPKTQTLTLPTGGELRYGLTLSILEFDVSRSPREPAGFRNYAPRLTLVPAEVGFQFIYRPASQPWRTRANGKPFQLMSWGGMILVQASTKDLAQGAIRLGATLSFFDETIGIGLGFDLYRGIPALGPDGTAGGATAYTGLLAWAFAPNGELTPENVFVVLTLGLEPIVRGLTGKL